ncbi:sensor histidine kinase [Streptomyces sclerotialus]|uniref:sensor histidine kinase n=1 Tax=Streptomyces sclerotialus TaxID=1957 RepID=UPI0006892BD1
MERTDDRLFPVLLLGAQVAVWPGTALVLGATPTAAELLAAALVAGLVTVVLTARRTHPVPVLILVTAACAVGAEPLPAGAVAVLGTAGVTLALFSVAAERDTTTGLLCVATLAVWQLVHGLTLHGLGGGQGLDLVLTTLLYAAATGTGLYLRRVRASRRAAERRLRRAETDRHRLPAAERQRMERELHDVSAHHLTAVVVTAEAALGLRDRRPELADEAVRFAAETGREVTRALSAVRSPAPSADDLPAPEERLRELVAGFRALGQPVTFDIQSPRDGTGTPNGGELEQQAQLEQQAWPEQQAQPEEQARPEQRKRPVHRDPLDSSVLNSSVLNSSVLNSSVLDSSVLDSSVGDAVYGIVREALTNVVRHASGAPTAVRCTYDDAHTEIVVRNAAPDASAGTTGTPPRGQGLGGGRGQNFLRSRARELGGTLTSGPTPDGGWEVRAVLPTRSGASAAPFVSRTYRLAQFVAAVGLCFQPLLPFLVIRESTTPTGPGVSAGALFALLAAAQAVMLLCLRRAPWSALSVLLVLAGLWPAAMAVSGYAGPVVLPPALSMLATCVGLAMVAAGTPSFALAAGVGSGMQRWAVPVVAAAVHAAALLIAVLTRGVALPTWVAAGAALSAMAAWAVGTWYEKRRRAALDTHEGLVAAWTEEAVRDAWAERRRITVGLETTVLARTAEVVEEAEAGRLAQTAERARDALAAMRALLETVRHGEQAAELRPQPTLQALDLLVGQWRATGRQVEVRLTDRVPQRLPTEVDIAAYRAAETVLETGGNDQPTVLVIDATDHVLTLTATGVSQATRLAARRRLVTRAAALGGTLATGQPGTVVLRLPLSLPAPLGPTPPPRPCL